MADTLRRCSQPMNPPRPKGRFRSARVVYKNVAKRKLAWLLLKDTVNSCVEYRVLGLAAEAAFFTPISIPPLLLALIGLLGSSTPGIGHGHHRLDPAQLPGRVGRGALRPRCPAARAPADRRRHPRRTARCDLARLRAGAVVRITCGQRLHRHHHRDVRAGNGQRGIVKTRLLAFLLYLVALGHRGAVALPLMVAGPDAALLARAGRRSGW